MLDDDPFESPRLINPAKKYIVSGSRDHGGRGPGQRSVIWRACCDELESFFFLEQAVGKHYL
jgi:hypothetical protein